MTWWVLRLGAMGVAWMAASCGPKQVGVDAGPRPDDPAAELDPASEPGASPGSGTPDQADEVDEADRLTLDAELHRTRVGLGVGLWALGVVHNPHASRVADVRVRVRLLDGDGAVVGEAVSRVPRPLAPDERAAVAVPLTEPVAHEQLRMSASAIVDTAPEPASPSVRLTHEPPQRADLGGWFVVGTVENTGAAPATGARVEIQALDGGGQLLGVDWLALDPIAPGDTVEFDVGDLRYEQDPARFTVELRAW